MSPATLTDRFWTKVHKNQSSDCWEWTGARNSRGYGQWGVQGRSRSVHRVAYEALVGPIPEGLVIDHLCRNKVCCNPAHLEPVTAAENIRRSPRAMATHCLRGHPLSGGNLRRNGRGWRSCGECENRRRRIVRLKARLTRDANRARAS